MTGSAKRPAMDSELRTTLARHREELLRRALALAVSRASLEELAERPLADRLDELELLFEAAGNPGRPSEAVRADDLQGEIERQLEHHRQSGRPFSVAVVAAGEARVARMTDDDPIRAAVPDAGAWARALGECAAPGDIVIDAGDGATAILLPDHGGREARMATERICRSAWRALGEHGPLAGAGVASHPHDGDSAYDLLAAAYDALWRQAELGQAPRGEDAPDEDRPPAPVHTLRPR